MGESILGIDIGGTGIKGAIVNIATGELLSDRVKIPTPPPATPQQVLEVVKMLVEELKYSGDSVGFGFPAVIKGGVCCTASNIDKSWIGLNVNDFFSEGIEKHCLVINDADAAGIAELNYGDISKSDGTVILLTLGTGIGSAMFLNNALVPNTEFGHLKFKGTIAEKYTSNKIREKEDLSYKEWGSRLSQFLNHLQLIFSPSAFILGGGVSKKMSKYEEYLELNTPIYAATKLNNAGIIGAAKNISF